MCASKGQVFIDQQKLNKFNRSGPQTWKEYKKGGEAAFPKDWKTNRS